MKTIEYNHGNNWIDKLLNSWPFCIDTESVKTIFRAGVCKNESIWHVWISTEKGASLYYNGAVFIRLMLPFWIGIQIRPTIKYYLQVGFGWKMNGRFGVIFRVQTDKSSEIGVHGPNYGHSKGFDCGTK